VAIEKKSILGILCLLVTAGLLFVGLWPFDLCPKNRAYWLPDEKGTYFDGQHRRFKLSVGGIAYTPSPLRSSKRPPCEKGSFTIDIDLRPALDFTDGVPHILAFIDSSGKELLYLGQWKQWLIVRWFSHDKAGNRWRKEIGVGDALVKDKTQRLTLVSNRTTCNIYVNGELAKNFQDTSLKSEKEPIGGYYLVLGNSREVKSPWTGSILALKVYDRALGEQEIGRDREDWATGSDSREGLIAAYVFDKNGGREIPDLSGNRNTITIPGLITAKNTVLTWPDWNLEKRAPLTKDLIVNVLGFVPFGFLLSLWKEQTSRSGRWRSYLFAILAGALISLGIEVAQAFIPARDSSMMDFLCNTGGTVVGAGFWELIAHSKRAHSS
jgi:hypothetical protein